LEPSDEAILMENIDLQCMQPNEQGIVYSYYGIWNTKNKPRLGVIYFMLDEHVKKTVEKEKEKFKEEMAKMISDFNKSVKTFFKKQEEEIKAINCSISEFKKFMFKTIELNQLEVPKVEKKNEKKKAKPKIDENEEDNIDDDVMDNGYL
jgi:hypothetical protein